MLGVLGLVAGAAHPVAAQSPVPAPAPADPGATTVPGPTSSTTTTVPLRPVLPVPILTPPLDLSVDVELTDGRDAEGLVRGPSDALAEVPLESDGSAYEAALEARAAIESELAGATDRITAAQERLATLAAGQESLDAAVRRSVLRVAKLTRIRDRAAAELRALGVRRYVDDPTERQLAGPLTDPRTVVEDAHESFLAVEAVGRGRRGLDAAQRALDEALERSARTGQQVRDVEAETRTTQAALKVAIRDRDRAAAALPPARREVRRARAATVVAGSDLPLVALDAYWRAAARMAEERPSCRIEWWLLAAVGRSESNHGRIFGGAPDPSGRVTVPIAGLPLDGTRGTRFIGDTDGGRFDGDPFVDRAVGTMQFIPGTWRRWQRDGSGDGINDPQNIYDGALTAAVYLCNSGPLDVDEGLRRAVFAYNRSNAYVDLVLARGRTYAALAVPATPRRSG